MRALTPADLTQTGRSPRFLRLAVPAFRPQPTQAARRSLSQSPQRRRFSRLHHGKTGSPQRYAESGSSSPACAGAGSADCRFTSGCGPGLAVQAQATGAPREGGSRTGGGAEERTRHGSRAAGAAAQEARSARAEERARRVERARQQLAALEQEKAARAKTHPQEEAEKSEPKV